MTSNKIMTVTTPPLRDDKKKRKMGRILQKTELKKKKDIEEK